MRSGLPTSSSRRLPQESNGRTKRTVHMPCVPSSIHLECLQRIRTVDRQEKEDILDSEVQWRCADCVSRDRFRPSAILEEFLQIHGKERILLIRWSGYEMAEDSLTHKDHLETDYTGLQAQLTRRRTERSRRRQDRYSKSVLACTTSVPKLMSLGPCM